MAKLTKSFLAASPLLIASTAAFKKDSFKAFLKNADTIETDKEYKLVIEWEHDSAVAPVVGKDLAKNAKKKGGACDPDAGYVAADGGSYWMPRFFPQPVSADVTKYTGVKFASPDWQPCGHKDIVICHGESHYDFHLYYQEEDMLKKTAGCDVNPTKPNHYIICDDITAQNNKMFSLMKSNIPVSRTSTAKSPMADTDIGQTKNVDYCMDPTSGVPMSGMHYGDRSETIDEWKEPVTIMGSHDCKLSFFEPMISWKWIERNVYGIQGWPHWHSGEIEYNEEEFKALPKRWSVQVTPGCEKDVEGVCKITVELVGTKCPDGGCPAPTRNCDVKNEVKNCLTQNPFVSTFKPDTSDLGAKVEKQNDDVKKTTPKKTDDDCEYGGSTHCFDPETGKTYLTNSKNEDSKESSAGAANSTNTTDSSTSGASETTVMGVLAAALVIGASNLPLVVAGLF